MTRKLNRAEDWISAKDSASLLSRRLNRNVSPEYLAKLAKRKKNPIRTRSLGYHQLYSRQDLEQVTIKKKRDIL